MTRRSDAGRGALEDLQQSRLAPVPVAGDAVAELEVILERVRRLRYDHNNPERFHAERSDIAGAIGGLLKRQRGEPDRRTVVALPAPRPRKVASTAVRAALREQRPILHLKGSHASA